MAKSKRSEEKNIPKERISVLISKEVIKKLRKFSEEYGTDISDMIESALRGYLEDFEDNVIAHHRYTHPEGKNISLEDAKKILGLGD